MKQEFFEVGQIVNTFGIKGFVKVKPFTDDMERFEELKSVLIVKKDKLIETPIEEIKYQNTIVLIKFKGYDKIEDAEKIKGCFLKINRKDAKKLPEGTYFIADLIGIEVYTDNGDYLGKVDDIYNNKAQDIYVVKDELGKQILLPGIDDVILNVDLVAEKITVHLLNGLV